MSPIFFKHRKVFNSLTCLCLVLSSYVSAFQIKPGILGFLRDKICRKAFDFLFHVFWLAEWSRTALTLYEFPFYNVLTFSLIISLKYTLVKVPIYRKIFITLRRVFLIWVIFFFPGDIVNALHKTWIRSLLKILEISSEHWLFFNPATFCL